MKAIIQSAAFVTPNVKRFQIETEYPLSALPGQFVTLSFPELLDDNNMPTRRSYSLLSWTSTENDNSKFELCISLNQGGVVTPWLWEKELPVEVESTDALGSFTLRDYNEDSNLGISRIVFICTGTGLVPFIPMIETILKNHPDKEVLLFSGNRNFVDELMGDQLKNWEKEFSSFVYFPVFSREKTAKNHGYVHDFYRDNIHLNCHVYVCGWSEMCKDARHQLKELGLTRKQYFFELYD
jgi:anthranilate 1,2-dioxygenase reductase subunit